MRFNFIHSHMKKYLFIVLLVGVSFGQRKVKLPQEQIKLYVTDGFFNPKYSGSAVQNNIIFEIFPYLKGKSFERLQLSWDSLADIFFDELYDHSKFTFPVVDFTNDPAYTYWLGSLNKKSDDIKYIYKNLYNHSIARLKYEANKNYEEHKKVFQQSTFKIIKGSYTFTTPQIGNKVLTDKALDLIRPGFGGLVEMTQEFIVYENATYEDSHHYIINYPEYGMIDYLVSKPWKKDILFKKHVSEQYGNELRRAWIEKNEPGMVVYVEKCSEQNYTLNIYNDGRAELTDQNKNKINGYLSPFSSTEGDIFFNSSEIPIAKIKVKNDGNISSITLKNECSNFSSLPVQLKNRFKEDQNIYHEKTWIKNGYIKMSGSRFGLIKSTMFVNFSDKKILKKNGFDFELFPIIYFDADSESDQSYLKAIHTHGFFDPINVLLNDKEYSSYNLPQLLTIIDDKKAQNLELHYEKIKMKIPDSIDDDQKRDRWIRDWMRDNVWKIKSSDPLPVIYTNDIARISKHIRDELSHTYYITEKSMTQKEINKIINSSRIKKTFSNILSSCLAIIIIIITA